MKVLQVLPELTSGGVERGTVELARYLVSEGHRSLVVSNGGGLVAQLEAEGSTHLTLPVHRKSLLSLRHVPALRRLLLEHQPDILHLRSRAPAWLFYQAWKGLPAGTRPRLVTTVHGFYSVNFYSSVMTKGERVICVSNSVKDYVRQNYPKTPTDKLTVIHRGVDLTDYNPSYQPSTEWLDRWQQENPQLAGQTLLTLPGRVTRWKGQSDFLQIIAKLRETHPQIHGLVVGGAHAKKRAYWDELHEQANELNLSGHLTFLGQRSDLREILAVSDLVYSLSHDPEAFGRVSLEALSLGKPVLGYHHGGVAEQLDALYPQGSVTPCDQEEVLAKTKSLLDREQSKTPRENQDFTLAAMNRSILAVYRDLLSEPGKEGQAARSTEAPAWIFSQKE